MEVLERVDLRHWTALRVGGAADLMIRCGTVSGVQETVDVLASHGVRWVVIGTGSRLVPPEAGLRVPLLHLTGELARWELDLDGLVAGAGATLTQVGRSVARAGLSGMERLSDTRGSLGGAGRRAVKGEGTGVEGLMEWVELVVPGRDPIRIQLAEAGPDTPPAPLERAVVSRVRLGLRADHPRAVQARIGARVGTRLGPPPAAASLFVEPAGVSARQLCERAGCGGISVGGAEMPEGAPNTVVTHRHARSEDIANLCRQVRSMVAERCGVELRPALCFVDETGRSVEP